MAGRQTCPQMCRHTQECLLLGKLAGTDMIASEAKYHPQCLLALYHSAARVQSAENITINERDESDLCSESHALAQDRECQV